MTSLPLRRKTALVLPNPAVRRKKEKQNPKPRTRGEIQRSNINKKGENKPPFSPGSNSSLWNSITTRQAYINYFPE